ncbi:hypothetical protein [Blastochloris tepida]|uniref:Uncharacterized protein n=1 Tax=Blastochloris tepida TaxID=2233851 RepID=A0A348FY33_9HYPH|nr:hypothetical protein [Blastochloris tepida]BBF92216.1 hypothetical protein BLTE_09010 [Blastochloris tepida]
MRRKTFSALTGWDDAKLKWLRREDLLFFIDEVEPGKWLDIPPFWAFLACVQKELAKYVEMRDARARVVDFDTGALGKIAPLLRPLPGTVDDVWLLSGEVHIGGELTGTINGQSRAFAVDLTLPVSAFGFLSNFADWTVHHRDMKGWKAGKVHDINNAMAGAVLINLSAVWRDMDARARDAGIADEHVWGRPINAEGVDSGPPSEAE